ncbi:MAG TPA: M12 family metallo-peptidase [Phycisphaerae bacterium]|nr:M12 family metallo-peptidase [Phycisphaerae bacterium]
MKITEYTLATALVLLTAQMAFGQALPNSAAKEQWAAPLSKTSTVTDPLPIELFAELRPAAKDLLKVADLELLQIAPRDGNGEKLVDVALDGQMHAIRLTPYTMRSEDFQVLVPDASGALVPTEIPDALTYRGYLTAEPQSQVAASIIDGKSHMTILRADGEIWNVQPIQTGALRAGLPDDLHAVYKARDVIGGEGDCGVAGLPVQIPSPNGGGEPAVIPEGGGPRIANRRCRIVFDTDVEFYQANGSSISATVTDIEMIMNQVGLIYQNQVAISYYETAVIVRTAIPQPYSSFNADTLLCQFGENWNNNLPSFPRNVGHLFTGKDLNGTTVGLGWIGAICAGNFNNCNPSGSSLAYSLVQSQFSTTLASRVQDSAHELGHNWNACHCNTGGNCGGGTSNPNNCGIMTSNISGQSTFDAAAMTAITSWRDSASCLDAWQNPTYVNWSYVGTSTGSVFQPWTTVGSGVYSALVGGEIVVQAGNYVENLTIHKPLTINAINGTVRIGN